MSKIRSIKTKISTITAITIIAGIVIILGVLYISLQNLNDKTARKQLSSIVDEVSLLVGNTFAYPSDYLKVIVSKIEHNIRNKNNNNNREHFQKEIFDIFSEYPHIDGSAIMLEANVFDGKDSQYIKTQYGTVFNGRLSYYYIKENGKSKYVIGVEENEAEYVQPYYTMAKEQKKTIVTEPYIYNLAGNSYSMITISFPIFDNSKNVVGVMTSDIFLDLLLNELQEKKIFETGYITLTNSNGTVLYSPRKEDLMKSKEEVGLDYEIPTDSNIYFSYANSIINNEKSLVATMYVKLPYMDEILYISVVAPLNEINAAGNALMNLVGGLLFLIMVVLIVAVYFTVSHLLKPMNNLVEASQKIASGNLRITLPKTTNDEIGLLSNNLNDCINTIGLLVKEINLSINEATNGNLEYRADANKFQGDYSKIMNGFNNLIEAFVEPIEITAEFLQDIATGNENIQKVTKEYKGEFNKIKNSINTVHDTLFTVLKEMEKATEQAERGELDNIKIDTSKVKGAWIIIMNGFNKISQLAGAIINDAGIALSTMATGDLTVRITNNYSGKFETMKQDINNLGDSLTELISQLQDAIHTTASASAQISATAASIAAATQEQNAQTNDVATSVEEMSKTIANNANNAVRTADVAKQSGEVANNSGEVVRQTVEKMREIALVVKTSAENIAKLGDSSKKINEIVNVINNIADQTNLLSLNAAIEAARAGEQGRGFAVVADSVGKLAISTASATKEIEGMIRAIQKDTSKAVVVMEKGTSEVQSGILLADQAGSSLTEILNSNNELLDMINQIAVINEEQSKTAEDISQNITKISQLTTDSTRNVEDVAKTVIELAKMTNNLTNLVSQFKINYGDSSSTVAVNTVEHKRIEKRSLESNNDRLE